MPGAACGGQIREKGIRKGGNETTARKTHKGKHPCESLSKITTQKRRCAERRPDPRTDCGGKLAHLRVRMRREGAIARWTRGDLKNKHGREALQIGLEGRKSNGIALLRYD